MLRQDYLSNGLPPDDFEPASDDEGGLRAPPHLKGWRKFWWWFDFLILVKLARLRFIAVLVAIGVVITQWDRLLQYYDRWTRPASAAEASGSDTEYFCPMHPTVVRDNSKDKCPICFMPLSKRKKGEQTIEALPAGVVNRVQLSPYRVVLAGVNTWTVDYQPLQKEIQAVGYIEFNERGQQTVAARVAGRLDRLFVNETGQLVEKGEPLAGIYSPDLFTTIQNLINAQKSQNRALEEGSLKKLELLGIDRDQIHECIENGEPRTHLHIRSPINGHVIKKYVREGEYVQEGSPLYDVADLSTVWVIAQIYEDDLAFLPLEQSHKHKTDETKPDLPVVATTRALPGEEFKGKLTFIYPHVDQGTRTLAVRFEIANPGDKLRPGMTAMVTLNVPPTDVTALRATESDNTNVPVIKNGHVLSVPETSVIDTGSQTIVYRQASPGVFEGVKVALGPKMNGPGEVVFFPVLGGLQPGEEIVTTGSFLVDAETRLNPAAGSIYFGGSGGSKTASTVTTVRPSTPEDPQAKVKAELAKLPDADRELAEAQRYCPVLTNNLLGSMGMPIKVMIDAQPVFLCCAGCKSKALATSRETLAQAKRGRSENEPAPQPADNPSVDSEIATALAELSPEDQELAARQRFCAVLPESRLGSMGTPVKLSIEGQTVFVCCQGCSEQALADPQATVAKVKKLR